MKARVAILADFLEEGWTSMDHYAAMLVDELGRASHVESVLVRPRFRERFGRMRWLLGPRHGRTLDLYWNRYAEYPAAMARFRRFDLFHIVDQTYAHLAARVPSEQAIVTCHDLDFAEPPRGTRHAWLVKTTGAHTLPGLRVAARVLCDSAVIRDEIMRRGLVPPERLVVVPLGVESEFCVKGPNTLSAEVEARLAVLGDGPRILHVGGMVARKRIDLLLRAFAAIRRQLQSAKLIRVGGTLSDAMAGLADRLGIAGAIASMPFLSRSELAALYRRCDLFVLSSETEGFGLPVLEAMASGVPVVARELAAVREVAADAIQHVPGDDPEALAAAAVRVLYDGDLRANMRARGLEQAARFSWEQTAARTARVYVDVLKGVTAGSRPALTTSR
jgi:glycosyltransferase involved in cell wall biosynthesis